MPAYACEEFFVLLDRVTTVGRELLPTHYMVAALSETARQLDRSKLADAAPSRNVARVSALEAELGRTIMEVRAMKARSGTATVTLVLDDGSEVQVDAKIDKKGDVRPERLRPVGRGARSGVRASARRYCVGQRRTPREAVETMAADIAEAEATLIRAQSPRRASDGRAVAQMGSPRVQRGGRTPMRLRTGSSPLRPSEYFRTEMANLAAPLIRSVARTDAGESVGGEGDLARDIQV